MPGPHSRARLLILALLAGTTGLTACSRDDSAQKTIDDAARIVSSLTGAGGQANPSTEARLKDLNALIVLLKPLAAKGDPQHSPAASLILSRATGALADIDSARAVELHRTAQLKSQAIRSSLETWLLQSSRAEARERFNPTEQLAAIDREAKLIDAEQARTQQAKSAAESAVRDLLAKAQGLVAESRTLRDQATAQREQASRGTATAGLPILEAAVAVQRRADALEVQAAELRNQAAAGQPAVDQAARDLERLARQRESLRVASEAITRQVEQGRREAEEARKLASAAAASIAADTKSLSTFLTDEFTPVVDKAAKGYQDAAGAARKASSAGSAAGDAKITAAAATQNAADALLLKARAIEDALALLNALAVAKPALPDAAAFAAQATAEKASFTAVLEEARTAFREARDAFEGSGARGEEAQARMTTLLNTLNAVIEGKGRLSAPPAEAAPSEAAPSDAAPTDGQPAAATTGDPVAIVTQMMTDADAALRAGDTDKLRSFYLLDTPEQEEFFTLSTAGNAAQIALSAATKEKLGKTLAEIAADDPRLGQVTGPGLDPALFNITPEPDGRVAITFKTAPIAWHAIQKDGQWKFQGILPNVPPPAVPVLFATARAMPPVLDSVTADVLSGSIDSIDNLKTQLMERVMKAMTEAMNAQRPSGG
jgi:hypothetical protein